MACGLCWNPELDSWFFSLLFGWIISQGLATPREFRMVLPNHTPKINVVMVAEAQITADTGGHYDRSCVESFNKLKQVNKLSGCTQELI